MTKRRAKGFTLVELMVAIMIMGIIGSASAYLVSTSLQAHRFGSEQADLHREAILAMERMTAGARTSTQLLVPNAHSTSRSMLAIAGRINDDGDFYFGDALFPRVDEDGPADWNGDGFSGIGTIDDDGDASTDEAAAGDDDEDGATDEDPIDGIDNDGDGSIDEDPGADADASGGSGILGMDDDADSLIDEGASGDDDEDGATDEDPIDAVVFELDGAGTLWEKTPGSGAPVALSANVTDFTVNFEPDNASHDARISISLTLTSPQGASITMFEYVAPRNAAQRAGKLVQ